MENKKKVVVIGAGPNGLLALKYLNKKTDIICFDSKPDIGGVWQFTPTFSKEDPQLLSNPYYKLYGAL